MRVLIAFAAVLVASLAMPPQADARQHKKARSPDAYPSRTEKRDYYAKRAYEDPADCVRAENLDPAGNFKAYPCWARKALSPQDGDGLRR
jgi:hypothetical protein